MIKVLDVIITIGIAENRFKKVQFKINFRTALIFLNFTIIWDQVKVYLILFGSVFVVNYNKTFILTSRTIINRSKQARHFSGSKTFLLNLKILIC